MTIKTVKYNELLAADLIAGRAECDAELKASLIAQAGEIFAEKGVTTLDQYIQFRDGLKKDLRELGPQIGRLRGIFREHSSLAATASDPTVRRFHLEEVATAWEYLWDQRAEYQTAYRLRRLGKAWSAMVFKDTRVEEKA